MKYGLHEMLMVQFLDHGNSVWSHAKRQDQWVGLVVEGSAGGTQGGPGLVMRSIEVGGACHTH